MDAIETIERDGYVGRIFVDEYPDNPRQMYDYPETLLVQLSSEYTQPDASDWRSDALIEAWRRAVWSRTLRDPHEFVERYARIFLDATAVAWWDDPRSSSRVVGIIEKGSDYTDPLAAIKGQVQEYAAWAVGDVYGYVVEGPDGETLDSCWGYYGDGELPYVHRCIDDAIDTHRADVHAERVAMFRRLVERAA